MINPRKAAVIGCGFVGSSSAFALMQSGLFSEIALLDSDRGRAEGEALDISHGIPFVGQTRIYAADYDGIVDSAIIIITAGAAQKPGETRLDLVNKNVGIFRSILPEIAKRSYEGIILVVAGLLNAIPLFGALSHKSTLDFPYVNLLTCVMLLVVGVELLLKHFLDLRAESAEDRA